ncbi:hypothetical protein CH378_00780 [Leptospira kmetyi]|uniref:Uncharacterized protein n=1 Tax=Leptospira kmetyi TaxID=408139 RepID=A0ABX4NEL2_9LEPT|nr:hypothetical protein CH378_00780 [Leptospira kmetyi]
MKKKLFLIHRENTFFRERVKKPTIEDHAVRRNSEKTESFSRNSDRFSLNLTPYASWKPYGKNE